MDILFSRLGIAFFCNNLLYSFTVILVSFMLGWFLYSKVVLRKINLKDALFEKDNLAGWVEFICAFVLPTFYLSAKAIEGLASDVILNDLYISLLYVVIYILSFTILRLFTSIFVGYLAPKDEEGKICLNNEIYKQNNLSASLFSVAASVILVNLISSLNFSSFNELLFSLLTSGNILMFTIFAVIINFAFQKGKTSIFSEIFVDNNVAAGFGFFGLVFAIQLLLKSAVKNIININQADLIIFSVGYLLIFALITYLIRRFFEKILKINLDSEIYIQNNVGAAIGLAALYIGIALVISNFAII